MILLLVEPNWQSPQLKTGYKPQAVPALNQIVGLRQARLAHHRVNSPDTGSNSRKRRITKKVYEAKHHQNASQTLVLLFLPYSPLRNVIQWGLEYRTLENRIHSKTEHFNSPFSTGSVFERSEP